MPTIASAATSDINDYLGAIRLEDNNIYVGLTQKATSKLEVSDRRDGGKVFSNYSGRILIPKENKYKINFVFKDFAPLRQSMTLSVQNQKEVLFDASPLADDLGKLLPLINSTEAQLKESEARVEAIISTRAKDKNGEPLQSQVYGFDNVEYIADRITLYIFAKAEQTSPEKKAKLLEQKNTFKNTISEKIKNALRVDKEYGKDTALIVSLFASGNLQSFLDSGIIAVSQKEPELVKVLAGAKEEFLNQLKGNEHLIYQGAVCQNVYDHYINVYKEIIEKTTIGSYKADIEDWFGTGLNFKGKSNQHITPKMDSVIKEISDKIKELEGFKAKAFSQANSKGICDAIPISAIPELSFVSEDIAVAIGTLNKVKEAILSMKSKLDSFQPTELTDCTIIDEKDLACSILAPTMEEKRIATVSIALNELNSTNSSIAIKQKMKATGTFTIRYNSSWIFEKGFAAVFSGLSYPNWGTRTVNGQTVVARAGRTDDPVHAAVTANFIFPNIVKNERLFPLFQLGVATAKENPALLVGPGLRIFAGKSPVSIAGGIIFSWAKELSKLNEGDPVTGTSDIEQDLSTKTFISWYVSIQTKF